MKGPHKSLSMTPDEIVSPVVEKPHRACLASLEQMIYEAFGFQRQRLRAVRRVRSVEPGGLLVYRGRKGQMFEAALGAKPP